MPRDLVLFALFILVAMILAMILNRRQRESRKRSSFEVGTTRPDGRSVTPTLLPAEPIPGVPSLLPSGEMGHPPPPADYRSKIDDPAPSEPPIEIKPWPTGPRPKPARVTMWASKVHEEIAKIISETRGVDPDECALDARLFEDVGLESIDFLEISFRMEESFGFPFPTDDLGEILNSIGKNNTAENIAQMLGRLKKDFFIEAPDSLPGVEPFNAQMLEDAVRKLLTVDALVTFVERKQHIADEVDVHQRGYR